MTGPVSGIEAHRIKPHDPQWASRAQDIITMLHEALSDNAVAIEHIGFGGPDLAERSLVWVRTRTPPAADSSPHA